MYRIGVSPLNYVVSLGKLTHTSKRLISFSSIFDRVKNWQTGLASQMTNDASKKVQEQRAKAETMQFNAIINNPSYSLEDHIKVIRDVMESARPTFWQSLRANKEQLNDFEKDLDAEMKIFESINPQEQKHHELIGRREKIRIANDATCTVEKVNNFLKGYEQAKSLWMWVQSRKQRKLSIPQSMAEFSAAMSADRTGMNRKAAMAQMGSQRRGKSALLKNAGF